MAGSSEESRLCDQLAEHTHTSAKDWYVVYRARQAMEVVFAAIADGRGVGEIITQPLTCITAVNPIIASGNAPVYCDISRETMSIDPALVVPGERTRAIIAQHTFGIVSDISPLRDVCDSRGLILVEDSAHCVGRMSRRDDGEPVADVSIHSFGAEKVLATKFGAAVWVNPAMVDVSAGQAIRAAVNNLPDMPGRKAAVAKAYRVENGVLNRLPGVLSGHVRGLLEKTRLIEPPILPAERRANTIAVPVRPAGWMVRDMSHAFDDLTTNYTHRQKATAYYAEALRDVDGLEIPSGITPDQPLLRFPIVLPTPKAAAMLFDTLRASGFYPGRWYRPTLFPGPTDPAPYSYDPATCPIAEDVSSRILNVPTDATSAEAKKIVAVVRRAV